MALLPRPVIEADDLEDAGCGRFDDEPFQRPQNRVVADRHT